MHTHMKYSLFNLLFANLPCVPTALWGCWARDAAGWGDSACSCPGLRDPAAPAAFSRVCSNGMEGGAPGLEGFSLHILTIFSSNIC